MKKNPISDSGLQDESNTACLIFDSRFKPQMNFDDEEML